MYDPPKNFKRDIYAYDERVFILRISIFIWLLFPDIVYLSNGFM